MQNINVKVAVGVGYNFIIANSEDIRGIALENTGTIVNAEGQAFPLYKGLTFAESRKVDNLMDTGKYKEYKIDECRSPSKRTYDVTITRFGCVQVEANSAEEAIRLADAMGVNDITWSDDWSATDAIAEN